MDPIQLWRSRWYFKNRQVTLSQLFCFEVNCAILKTCCVDHPILHVLTIIKIPPDPVRNRTSIVRNRGNSWKTHLKNLISVRWDSYKTFSREQIAKVWWSRDVQRVFVAFKENHIYHWMSQMWTFAILSLACLDFGARISPLGFEGIRNSDLLFFPRTFPDGTVGRRPETCFCGRIPSSCDMYRVRTESQRRLVEAEWLPAQTRKVRKIPSVKPEEWRDWIEILVGMRVDIKLSKFWISLKTTPFFWWVL